MCVIFVIIFKIFNFLIYREPCTLFRLRIVPLFWNTVLKYSCLLQNKNIDLHSGRFQGSWIHFYSLASTDANSHCNSNVFLWFTDNRPVPTRHFVCFPFILVNSSSCPVTFINYRGTSSLVAKALSRVFSWRRKAMGIASICVRCEVTRPYITMEKREIPRYYSLQLRG